MTVFMCMNAAGADKLAFTLGEKVIVRSNFREARNAIDNGLDEQLVVVGPDVSMSEVHELTSMYRISRPTLGVVLVRRKLDVSTMNEAIQTGVREVVASDDGAGLINACRRSLNLSKQLSENSGLSGATVAHSGKSILIFSAKGGCGKTTLSVNLAQALAMDSNTKVCIVDFDLQFGDVAVSLHVEPKKTISDILDANNVDQLSLQSVLQSKEKNLDLLLAPNNPADVERINSNLANAILVNLRSMYDYVIIDSPPAFTNVILKAFDLADAYILLTTLDMPAIKNLRISMQTLRALGLSDDICYVIVNRSNSKAGLSVDDVERAIDKKVFAKIPTSIDVPATTNLGSTIVKKYPKHKVSKEIIRLSAELRVKTNGKRTKPPKSIFRWKRSK